MKLPRKTGDRPITRSARARFYAAVTRMDQDLASTMDAVDAVLGKDTFVLYSTDHGPQWPFGKWNLYDTGTRVPMVVRWNGQIGRESCRARVCQDVYSSGVSVSFNKKTNTCKLQTMT